MFIIQRRATANHAEDGPILDHMGRKWVEKWANFSACGRRLGAKPPLAPIVSPTHPQGAVYMRLPISLLCIS